MEHNFREQGTSVKMNFEEHQNLFLGNKGEIAIFCRAQGNMHPRGFPFRENSARCLEIEGTVFLFTGRPRPANNLFIVFSLQSLKTYI